MTDPEGDASFTWTVTQEPLHGTVEIDANGRLTDTANADYVGTDEVWVTVTDSSGLPPQSTSARVDVQVTEPGFLGCNTGGSPANALWVLGLGGRLVRRRR